MATVASITVTAGSGGIVDLAAPLRLITFSGAPSGTFQAHGIWQWDSTGGGVWVDLGTETTSSPDCVVFLDFDSGEYGENDGTLSVSYHKTGLTSGSSYNFRLQARNHSGTRTMSLAGTASGVGS
jgi:hypothetical protein